MYANIEDRVTICPPKSPESVSFRNKEVRKKSIPMSRVITKLSRAHKFTKKNLGKIDEMVRKQ